MTRLNLGCGRKRMHGFVNIDIREAVAPDRLEDVFTLTTFKPGSVDLIYACHVLEHATRAEVPTILKRWCELLKVGGILRVCVPDLHAAAEYYRKTHDLKAVQGLFYGGQRNAWDFHRTGFDFSSLGDALINAGFTQYARYDWQQTDHSFVDDYSASYLPRISYHERQGPIDGTLVSLNVEAIK